jgi:hypothetical protein
MVTRSKKLSDYYITKASGEQEPFEAQKLVQSLIKVGASSGVINLILDEIKKGRVFTSAKDIYKFASKHLRKYNKGVAGRYNLKNALRDLGPTGYPFERFVAQIFKNQGYDVKVSQIAKGLCVSHELDAIVKKGDEQYLIECKFHNKQGLKCDVKVPLYIKARFDDIREHWKANQAQNGHYHQAWIFTNTKFTLNAIQYAECIGIRLVGWSYPNRDNLAQIIDKLKLYPITVLTSLSKYQKKVLVENDVVLCKQICTQHPALKRLGLGAERISNIISEARSVCGLRE